MPTLRTLTSQAVELAQARSVAVRAAEDAGALLFEGATSSFGGAYNLGVRTKSVTGDLVTELDLAAERLIVGRIRTAFPYHRIISEEAGLLDAADDSWTWLVDPLDGTNNVAIGLSDYVVGIALCHFGTPVLGVVHEPVRRQTWSALRGRGTLGPGGAVRLPSFRPAKHGPVLAWAQGYDVGRDDQVAQALRITLETRSRRVLQLWAPLLAWVMLARGDIDGFVGYRPESIDLPAGCLIAREAGMVVCDFDGAPFDEAIDQPYDRSFVAGRPQVIQELLAMVHAARHVRIAGVTSNGAGGAAPATR